MTVVWFRCPWFVAVLGVLCVLGFMACSPSAKTTDLRAAAEAIDAGISADEAEIVRGVPDHNRDPAVVAISVDHELLCSASLISPRILLTARHCVSRTVEPIACPGVQILGDRDPSSIEVFIGDDTASAHSVARGASLVTPFGATLCDADIALVILDTDVKTAKPLPVRALGVNTGDRVRSVGFSMGDDRAFGIKLVREHVRVLSISASEFAVGEAACQGDSGGPAMDEATSEIVGVVSRPGPACEGDGVHNIYTRVDAFSWLVDEAFAQVAGLSHDGNAGVAASLPAKGTKTKPPSDTGGPCDVADDCAAGICLIAAQSTYCSRTCGTGDKCPNGFHCQTVGTSQVCVSTK